MPNIEDEYFDRKKELEQRWEFENVVSEAQSLGLDTARLILDFTGAYLDLKNWKKTRELVDRGILSEPDFIIACIRGAIREKRQQVGDH